MGLKNRKKVSVSGALREQGACGLGLGREVEAGPQAGLQALVSVRRLLTATGNRCSCFLRARAESVY